MIEGAVIMLVLIFCSAVGVTYQHGSELFKKRLSQKSGIHQDKNRKGTQNIFESDDMLTSRFNKSNRVKSMQIIKHTGGETKVIKEIDEDKISEEPIKYTEEKPL